MPQLRYDLIGDASSFQKASSDLVGSAEQMEGALEGLEQNVAALTEGQLRYNEAADRFRTASGEFVSGAEAQSRALEELNSEGAQTTQQIREQIGRLERLEDVYGEDALASRELTRQQQRLRTQLAEVGAASAQQNRDLSRLDQQFEQATVAMTDFAGRQDRLQQELRATAAAQERVESTGVTMRSGVQASANNLGFEFVQAAQDAQFGAAGVANQIPLMTEQFTQLQAKTGSTTGALRAFAGSIFGTAGIIGAITLGLPLVSSLVGRMTEASDAADSADESFQGFFNTLDSGVQNLEQFQEGLPNIANALEGFGTEQDAGGVAGFFQDLQAVGDIRALQSALNGSGEEARFLRNMLDRMGADLSDLTSENLRVAQEELREFRTEIELLAESPEAAIQRFPGGFAEQVREQFQSVRQQQQDLVGSGLTSQQDALEQQVSFLEDALTQARGTLSQAQFQEAFSGLQSRLQTLRAALGGLERSAESFTTEVGDVSENVLEPDIGTFEESLGLFTELEQSIIDAREESGNVREEFERLLSPQGVALAQARRTKEEFQGQVQALRNVNRIVARRQSGTEAEQVDGAGPATGDLGTSIDQLEEEVQRLNQSLSETGEEAEAAGDSVNQSVNRELVQGIQLASQLGATLIQSAQEGSLSFQQAFSSILQTVGAVVGIANPAIGAGISGAGTLISSFKDGGTMPRSGLAQLHPPEIVTGLPGGAQVVARDETMDMLAAQSGRDVTIRLEAETKRTGPAELGTVLREVERFENRHPTRR